MTRIVWGESRQRTYEIGLDRGVLFPEEGPGVVWTGLTRIEEINANRTVDEEYFDGKKFRNTVSSSEFQARLSAYSAPKEFMACDGYLKLASGFYAGNQRRKKFGLSYRTLIGNATIGEDYGYRIHVVYNAVAIPDQKNHATMIDSTEPVLNSWTLKTIPYYRLDYAWFKSSDGVELEPRGSVYRPVSHLVIDSTSVSPQDLALLEKLLYGTETTEPQLPAPIEMVELIR